MSPDETDGSTRTARTVGQLVKYNREMNQSRTVNQVGSYALEATYHVMQGHPTPTVSEVGQNGLRVLETMRSGLQTGDEPDDVTRSAYDANATVVRRGPDTTVAYRPDEMVVEGAADGSGGPTIAVPSYHEDETDEVGVVLSAIWSGDLATVEQHHVKPLEYLAEHVATAIDNIRSRERLERARNDLETRKEMVELYDRLLRHDLGNDLQVIAGFSDVLARSADGDGQVAEYAEKVNRTAMRASERIDRVGDVVRTLESEPELEPRALRPILTEVVDDVDARFDSLAVEFDPADLAYTVYAGDLLESIFTNVLSNAAVHNDDPVTVRIYDEEPAPDEVVVGFADDGTGIAAEVRDEIFEMGKKGPDSDGTGFGLGLTRALTQSYGGTVSARESEAGGADFRVRLRRP